MKRFLIATLIRTLLFSLTLANADNVRTAASSAAIDSFSVTHVLARDAIQKLALDHHIVIGVSGTLVGSDDKLIDINLTGTTLKGVLDAIVAADPKYRWTTTSTGSLSVNVGASLGFISIRLHEFRIIDLSPSMVASHLEKLPKIAEWLRSNSCSFNEIRTERSGKEQTITMIATDQSVAQILDSIAVETGSYSWLVLKFLDDPCEINVVP
jgi:hypothetical protein